MVKTLKIIIQQRRFAVGCCGGTPYGEDEKATSPQERQYETLGPLLTRIKEHYRAEIEVTMVDPRNILSLIDNVRYNIKGNVPAWILEGEKIYEGIPTWEQIHSILESKLKNNR